MKKIIIISCVFLASCFSGPEFVPSAYKDSPMSEIIRKEAASNDPHGSYQWLFWYGPVAAIALMWGYKEFVKKKEKKDGN